MQHVRRGAFEVSETAKQRLKNIALVCKRFYRICLDDSLITELYFGRKQRYVWKRVFSTKDK
mgnify:CR=1 FL=1